MPKKGENIRKRKDGRWEARYKRGLGTDGRPVYASVYGKTYREARERKQLALSNQLSNDRHDPILRFQDIQELWWAQNSVHLKASTKRKYAYLLQSHILPELGSLKLTHITAPYINQLLATKIQSGRLDHGGGLSPSYVRSMMLIIRSIMSFAAAEKYCAPLSSNINKPALAIREITLLTTQQRIQLESVISTNPSATEIGILIALYTGLRIGEICALSWDDIDFENKLVTVRHTVSRIDAAKESGTKSQWVLSSPKTVSSFRIIPICSDLFTLLWDYRKHSHSPFVVSTAQTFVSPRTYEYRFQAILKKIGIPRITFHTLRHNFATRCVEKSVDVKSLSEILGHSSEMVTLRTYVHSSLECKREQLEKINHIF